MAEVLNCDKKIRQIVRIRKNAPIFALGFTKPNNDIIINTLKIKCV